MKTEQIIILIVAFFLGVLLLNTIKGVCGCDLVEGQSCTSVDDLKKQFNICRNPEISSEVVADIPLSTAGFTRNSLKDSTLNNVSENLKNILIGNSYWSKWGIDTEKGTGCDPINDGDFKTVMTNVVMRDLTRADQTVGGFCGPAMTPTPPPPPSGPVLTCETWNEENVDGIDWGERTVSEMNARCTAEAEAVTNLRTEEGRYAATATLFLPYSTCLASGCTAENCCVAPETCDSASLSTNQLCADAPASIPAYNPELVLHNPDGACEGLACQHNECCSAPDTCNAAGYGTQTGCAAAAATAAAGFSDLTLSNPGGICTDISCRIDECCMKDIGFYPFNDRSDIYAQSTLTTVQAERSQIEKDRHYLEIINNAITDGCDSIEADKRRFIPGCGFPLYAETQGHIGTCEKRDDNDLTPIEQDDVICYPSNELGDGSHIVHFPSGGSCGAPEYSR